MRSFILISSVLVCIVAVSAQEPSPTTTPTPVVKLAPSLKEKLDRLDRSNPVSREARETAYRKLLEGQRNIWRMRYQRTQAGRMMFGEQARTALVASLDVDPTLSEAYVALTELTLMLGPTTFDEPVALISMAVDLNKDSVGGHKFYARFLTRQAQLRMARPNIAIAAKAIEEWKEVTRLDPRSSEAWAMLTELYEKLGKNAESIDSLKRWVAATAAVDTIWYRQIIGGQAEDLAPENAAPRLAEALIAAGRLDEGIAILTQILVDDPSNTEVFELITRAVGSADIKTAGRLIESVRQVQAINPDNVTLLISFAQLVSRYVSVDEGVRLLSARYEKLLSTDRAAAANLQVSIGDIYLARDRYTEAASAFELALTARSVENSANLDPDEREFATLAYEKLVDAHRRAHKIDDAKAAIARSRKLLGNIADRMLIALYRDTGDRAEALKALRELRIKEPGDVTLLRLEATLLAQTGQIEKGVEVIRQRIASGKTQANPVPRLDDDFSNYLFIAQLYNDAGKGVEAASVSDEAYQVAGSEDRRRIARLMKASAQQSAGQFAAAETILREIIKAAPRFPIALNNLGYFLLERGERLTEAFDLIKQAIEIDPTNPSYLDSLGWAHFKLGRIDDAAKSLEEAARLNDSSATIHEHLGDVYLKKGWTDRAKTSFQRAAMLSSDPTELARLKQKLASIK